MSGPKAKEIATRFWPKVQKTDSCWNWTASLNGMGYGQFFWKRRDSEHSYMRSAHVVAYELCIGPVPDGKELDHLCRNKACVNPAHLEAVDHKENVLRGHSIFATKARQTHCARGHLFDWRNGNGTRRCRVCKSFTNRRWWKSNGHAANERRTNQ